MSNWRIETDGIFNIPENKFSWARDFVASLGGRLKKIDYHHSVHQIEIKGSMVTNDLSVAQRFQRSMQHFGGQVRLCQAEDSKRRTGGYRQVVTR